MRCVAATRRRVVLFSDDFANNSIKPKTDLQCTGIKRMHNDHVVIGKTVIKIIDTLSSLGSALFNPL